MQLKPDNTKEKEKELKKVLENVSGNETTRIPATILEKQTHMVCHYLVGKEWEQKEFTANKTKYYIGSSSHDSEIAIAEPDAEKIQVLVQKVGDTWFAMEYARKDLLCINGIPDYQTLLESNGYRYLRIGSSKLVLVKGDSKLKVAQTIKGDNKFTLKTGDSSMTFSTSHPCLIGSNDCSDFVLNQSMFENNLDPVLKEPFLALINTYKNQLFIDSISEKFPVIMQGRVLTEPTPIAEGSQFALGGLEFTVTSSTSLDTGGDVMLFSDVHKKTFMFLQVLEDENENVINLELPQPGKAASIGRGEDATYTIDNLRISKQHAQLIVYEKSVLVSDLGSTNGTFVNDEKIKKKLMHPGDFITIGDYIFFLCYKED